MNQNKRTTILIVVLVIIAALLLPQIPYLQGYHAYQKGDYQTTLKKLERCSNKRSMQLYTDAAIHQGELALLERNYKQAADYFTLCEPNAHEQWSEAISLYIIDLAQNGQLDVAKEVFDGLETENLIIDHVDNIWITFAEQTVADISTIGEINIWDHAKTIADQVYNKNNNSRLATFNDRYYFANGTYHLSRGDIESSLENFHMCTRTEITETYVQALQSLQKQDFMEAVQLLETLDRKNISNQYTYVKEEPFQIPWDYWSMITRRIITSTITSLDAQIEAEKAYFYFTEKQSGNYGNQAALSDVVLSDSDVLDNKSSITSLKYGSNNISVKHTLFEFYKSCGSSPEGKILILRQTKNYNSNSKSISIALNLMRDLPYKYFPESLSQVEYIILLDYHFSKVGSYTVGSSRIPAIEESGLVRTLHMPKQRQLYSSSNVYGYYPPSIISASIYNIPDYRSGGAPDLEEKLTEALRAIEKEMAK